jgi:hypothetical protein
VAAALPEPKAVMEEFMRGDVEAMTAAQTRQWLKRLSQARTAIDDATTPNAQAMNDLLKEFQLACARHLQSQ